jgi:uncharacterized protein YbbK (DUF523 family)
MHVLVSGCLAGRACGYDGTSYGDSQVVRELLGLPNVRAIAFCPEDYSFGTPRELCHIEEGNGCDVLDGKARVFTETGLDWTAPMIRAAEATLDKARMESVHLAVLMDISAACGSQVIYHGPRNMKQYQKGPGVCAALLIRSGYPVVSQRDFRTLRLLFEKLGAQLPMDDQAVDHHETEWYRSYFALDK